MNNNDILRRIRDIFSLDDSEMGLIFDQADVGIPRETADAWLKKDNDSGYPELSDSQLAVFLNGFINYKRGKKEGPQPEAQKYLTNNIIFNKLKIALNLQADDVMEVLEAADLHISRHELSAIFRKPGNKHFRECTDQMLDAFLKGLQLRFQAEA